MSYRAQLVVRTSELEGATLIEEIRGLASETERTISEVALDYLEAGRRSLEGKLMTMEEFIEQAKKQGVVFPAGGLKIDFDPTRTWARTTPEPDAEPEVQPEPEPEVVEEKKTDSKADAKKRRSPPKNSKKKPEEPVAPITDSPLSDIPDDPQEELVTPYVRDLSRQAARERQRLIVEENKQFVEDIVEIYETKGLGAAAEAISEHYSTLNPIEGAAIRKTLKARLTAADTEELFSKAGAFDGYKSYQDRLLFGNDSLPLSKDDEE